MAGENPGVIISQDANESITAHRIVSMVAASDNTVEMYQTSTSNILGVSHDFGESGGSVPITISGTARVECGASVSTGAIVGPSTASSGQIVERANPDTTTTANVKTLGIALQSGSTNSVIKVALQIDNKTS